MVGNSKMKVVLAGVSPTISMRELKHSHIHYKMKRMTAVFTLKKNFFF